MNYKHARAQLKPEQEEFLMELLAADDALIESASRGIVDDVSLRTSVRCLFAQNANVLI